MKPSSIAAVNYLLYRLQGNHRHSPHCTPRARFLRSSDLVSRVLEACTTAALQLGRDNVHFAVQLDALAEVEDNVLLTGRVSLEVHCSERTAVGCKHEGSENLQGYSGERKGTN